MVEGSITIINLYSNGKSYGQATINCMTNGRRTISFHLTLKKFNVGMEIGSDLWILFTDLQRDFGFRGISEIQFTDGNKMTLMHANYFLTSKTVLATNGLVIDDYCLDADLLTIVLYEDYNP